MPSLQAAVALPEVHDVAVVVGQDLDFDVAGVFDVLFEVDSAVLEGGLGLGSRGLNAGFEGDLVHGDAHAAAAAAGSGLD